MSARPKGSARPQRSARRKYGERRRLPVPILPIAGILIAAVGGFFLIRSFEIGAPGERIAVTGVGQHIAEGQPIVYNSVPPVGGPHWPAPVAWGASTAPIPDERVVHNLEHGGVVISYNAISSEDLTKLIGLSRSYPRDRYNEVKLVIRPYEAIPAGTFVLAAWGWKQTFNTYDDAAVRAFLEAHLNRCCENVP